MREQTSFNQIVLRTVTRIVGHANRKADRVRQHLQIILHDVLRRGVAASTVEQQEKGTGVRITLATDAVPVPLQTVARKLAGVMRQSQVEVSSIPGRIVDAMRNQHAVRPTGEVVIKRLRSLAAPRAALAKQPTQELFRFRIHGKVRLPGGVVLVDQVSNVKKLRVPVGRASPGNRLVDFSQTHLPILQPRPNRIVADGRPQAVHFDFEALWGQVRKDDRLFVRITARPGLQK